MSCPPHFTKRQTKPRHVYAPTFGAMARALGILHQSNFSVDLPLG